MAAPWLFILGFAFVYLALLSKAARVWYTYTYQDGSLESKKLLIGEALLLFPLVLTLILWQALGREYFLVFETY
jgi:hypothetical protein